MVREKHAQKRGREEKIDLRPLKKWLQRGQITEICDEIGIKETQASNIIAGRSTNWLFVKLFLDRVENNKRLKQRIEDLS